MFVFFNILNVGYFQALCPAAFINCPLQTTNCSSYGLQEEIIHINEDEGKIALSSTKHNFLITPPPSCLRTIQLLRSPSKFYFPFTITTTFLFFPSSSSYDLRAK